MTDSRCLNEAQRRAAAHAQGPLLIIAGAGAGKTHTITHRMLNLVRSGVLPSEILAITFTNKAAGELRTRLSALLEADGGSGTPFAATFHALGVSIMREEHERIGIPRMFGIADRDESLSFVKQAMKRNGIDRKTLDPKKLLAAISRAKNTKVESGEVTAATGFAEVVRVVRQEYERLMRESGVFDFDDLIAIPLGLLESDAGVRSKYQKRFRYVHIDEYQDTSTAQDRFATLLVGPEQNICVIGDSDQSIYGWRDANPENILTFPDRYPGATIVTLEENYRSTSHILRTANEIIRKNTQRTEKNLFTTKEGGEKITVYEAWDETDEARFVAETCVETIDAGIPAGCIAVLFRANFQSRALEEAFLRIGVPYRLAGVRFYQRKEVKDVLAYLKYAINPNDVESLRRAIASPRRGIGPANIEKIRAGEHERLPPKMRGAYEEFNGLIRSTRERLENESPSAILAHIVKSSGLVTNASDDSDGEERAENMRELVSLATKYDALEKPRGIEQLLTDTGLISDQDTLDEPRTGKEKGGVCLMTVHASKGLEFDTVFVTGLEHGLFPHRARESDTDASEIRKEEERRLCYVAVTRAERTLYLTYALYRTIFGEKNASIPSVFLQDIREEFAEFHSSAENTDPFTEDGKDDIQWDCLSR